MMIALLIATVWVLAAGFALTLFSAAKNADRRAEAMLSEAQLAEAESPSAAPTAASPPERLAA